jgi:hypothetical protein
MSTRRTVSVTAAAVVFLTVLVSSTAIATPEKAMQAERMLSPHRWAQAVRIENTNEGSRYPETVYGTVFEFNDTLWFYTVTGSQQLRASKGRTDEYKDNLLPLLRTMERGFTSFTSLSSQSDEVAAFPSLKNGCVVESIFSLDELKQQGEPILQAKLLLYSSKNPTRSHAGRATGHAVLVYQTPSGIFYVDPPKIEVTGLMKKTREWDPKEMAREIESHYGKIVIEDAFFEEFALPVTHTAQSG